MNTKDMMRKITLLAAQAKNYFLGNEAIESAITTGKKQRLNLFLLIAVVVIGVVISSLFLGSNKKEKAVGEQTKESSVEEELKEHKPIELGSEGTKGAVKWANFLEEAIEEEGNKRALQIDLLKQTVDTSLEATRQESGKEFEEIKSRLAYALNEIDRMKADNQNLQNDLAALGGDENITQKPAELGLTSIVEHVATRAPLSTFNHIPNRAHVTGYLLGGFAVSTSVNSKDEPKPITIIVTGRGSLPDKFAVDIRQCEIAGSVYGDISSERAIIRLEELICVDKKAGLITRTKVAGLINGDDGIEGIRGLVVSMSGKHLRSAFVGGALSGLANTSKGQAGFNITSLGAINTKRQSAKDMAEEGLMQGTRTALEKIADYEIKFAERISPVIVVPGGTKVDVTFTETVEIGSLDIEETINAERKKTHAK